MKDHANTKKLLNAALDDERTASLRAKFDKVVATMKLPASDNSRHNIDSVYHWHVPKHILAFLVNILEDSSSIPKLAPWADFKSSLHDFYEFRVLHAQELSGSTNNFYVNLEEMLLLYFLDKCKLRRIAEQKLLEMLASLKYYWEMWPRAKTFALMTNLIKPIIQDVNIAKG
jgi:hypothetical protein